MQGDKDYYRAMLVALQGVTGAPVAVGEKERGFIPVGLTTAVAKDSGENKNESPGSAGFASAGSADTVSSGGIGTVSVATNPDGADVYVDGQFYGNSAATLKLKPGKHTIGVKMSGYKDWSRKCRRMPAANRI